MAKAPLKSISTMSPEEVTALNTELAAWVQAKKTAAAATATEMELRKAFVAKYFSGANSDGDHNIDVGFGHRLVATLGTNRKLDKKVFDALTQLPPDDPKRLSEQQCKKYFSFSPSLVLAAYKVAPKEDLRVLSEIITETPAAPALKLEKVT